MATPNPAFLVVLINAEYVPIHRQNLPSHTLVYQVLGEDEIGQTCSTVELDCASLTEEAN